MEYDCCIKNYFELYSKRKVKTEMFYAAILHIFFKSTQFFQKKRIFQRLGIDYINFFKDSIFLPIYLPHL